LRRCRRCHPARRSHRIDVLADVQRGRTVHGRQCGISSSRSARAVVKPAAQHWRAYSANVGLTREVCHGRAVGDHLLLGDLDPKAPRRQTRSNGYDRRERAATTRSAGSLTLNLPDTVGGGIPWRLSRHHLLGRHRAGRYGLCCWPEQRSAFWWCSRCGATRASCTIQRRRCSWPCSEPRRLTTSDVPVGAHLVINLFLGMLGAALRCPHDLPPRPPGTSTARCVTGLSPLSLVDRLPAVVGQHLERNAVEGQLRWWGSTGLLR